jgi:hypothetical protein
MTDILTAATQPDGFGWRALPCTVHRVCLDRLVGDLPFDDEDFDLEAAVDEVMRRWRSRRPAEWEGTR